MNIIDKNQFIALVAQKSNFTKGDVHLILDTIVQVFEESVSTNTEISIRGFGKLHTQKLKGRTITKGKYAGKVLAPTTRTTFKLAENIRFLAEP